MTKSFSNFTSSTNKTKEKTIKNDSVDNVDKLIENTGKIMDDLSMEDFQKVLEQVTDYSLPESEKSPLVQQLNQQYAKEDNCPEVAMYESSTGVNTSDNMNNSATTDNRNTTNRSSNNTKQSNIIDTIASINSNIKIDHQQLTNESPLSKLENFCDQFADGNRTLLNNNWDLKRTSCRLNNGTLASSNESLYSSSSLNKASHSSVSSQAYIHNHHQLPENSSSKCCDNINCESCRLSSRPLFNASNNVSKIEMKDYSKRAQIVEYTSALSLNNNNKNHSDHHGNPVKIDIVNTQFAENYRNELSDTNRNYSSDCLNRYPGLDDKQSHKTLSSSTSDGHISNTYFDVLDKSSSYHLNSNYLKKGSTSSSIQTNGKSETNYPKKRKKPEKAKLTQDCEGYVGYKDIQFLTNYITGNNSETTESMRDTATINSSKEMNGKKKDKKELNDLNVAKKRNSKDTNESNNTNATEQLTNETIDLTNDKNNNNLSSATNNNSNNNNIIPNSSTNHQSSSHIRKESTDLSVRVVVSNENNMNNLNNQTKQNNKQQIDKRNDKSNNKITSSSRKSSVNLDILNNQQTVDDKQSNQNNAQNTPIQIVSNGLVEVSDDFDSIDCTQSDPEDKESGFKIVKYKILRRKKQKAGKLGIDSNESSKQNSGKKDQHNHSSSANNPATARGYESESDYCAVEGRKRGGLEERNNQSEVKQLLEYKDALARVPGLNDQQTRTKRSKRSSATVTTISTIINDEKSDDHSNSVSQQQSQDSFILAPYTINNTVSQSKFSYAAIAKMHYSNPTTTNGIVASSNSTTNQTTEPTVNNKKDKKRNSMNNSDSKQSNKSNNKGINLNEDCKQSSNSMNNKSNDKKESTNSNKQQSQANNKKQINKLNNKVDEPTTKESITAESSNDSSRTISLDTNETPSVISSKSNSFNSTNQPPVIMFDHKNNNQSTTFTFGFFDENAQFDSNNAVDEQVNEHFESININSVNFISKESSNAASNHQQQNTEQSMDIDDSESNNVANTSLDNNDELVKVDSSSSLINTGTPVSISTIFKSPINSATISNSSTSTLNSNTPIYEGTYIMECEEDGSSSNAIRDNITKRVQAKSNDTDLSSVKPTNEITSYNLSKFKEKIPSPIDHHQQYHQQKSNRSFKSNRPEFTCNVAYIQAVKYVRRAWDDVAHNPKTYRFKYDGQINYKLLEMYIRDKDGSKNLLSNIQACN